LLSKAVLATDPVVERSVRIADVFCSRCGKDAWLFGGADVAELERAICPECDEASTVRCGECGQTATKLDSSRNGWYVGDDDSERLCAKCLGRSPITTPSNTGNARGVPTDDSLGGRRFPPPAPGTGRAELRAPIACSSCPAEAWIYTAAWIVEDAYTFCPACVEFPTIVCGTCDAVATRLEALEQDWDLCSRERHRVPTTVVRCASCTRAEREQRQRVHEHRRASGLCLNCGDPVPSDAVAGTVCDQCSNHGVW
jgi:hypothetical protein